MIFMRFTRTIRKEQREKAEKRLLSAIKKNPFAQLEELAVLAGFSGASHADYHLRALKAQGIIRKVPAHWEILTD